jgi:hypothetical protein
LFQLDECFAEQRASEQNLAERQLQFVELAEKKL